MIDSNVVTEETVMLIKQFWQGSNGDYTCVLINYDEDTDRMLKVLVANGFAYMSRLKENYASYEAMSFTLTREGVSLREFYDL